MNRQGANFHVPKSVGGVSMMASGTRTADVIIGRQQSGVDAISKYSFGRRTHAIQMTEKSTALNMPKNFINVHARTSQICMKIPQSHIENEIQYT